MRIETSCNKNKKRRSMRFTDDVGEILIHIEGFRKENYTWHLVIQGGYDTYFPFKYYGRWNEEKVAQEVLDQIDEYNRAKLVVFNEVFK